MSKLKKLVVLLVTLTMVFASAVPCFAVEWGDSGKITVPTNPTPETGIFHVTLNIQGYSIVSGGTSGPIKDFDVDVEMGASGITDTYTVEDVLIAFGTQYSSTYQLDMTPDDDHPHYLHSIKTVTPNVEYISRAMKNGSATYYCGWMFRINERIPMVSSTDAALINEAYVNDGDIIDLFYANPYNQTYSTKYTVVSYDTENNSYQALFSDVYVANNGYDFEIKNFSPVALKPIKVYVDGVLKTTTLTNGLGHFSIPNVSSGDHMVKIEYYYNGYNTFTDPDATCTDSYKVPQYLDSYTEMSF